MEIPKEYLHKGLIDRLAELVFGPDEEELEFWTKWGIEQARQEKERRRKQRPKAKSTLPLVSHKPLAWLPTETAAQLLGVSTRRVTQLAHKGILEAVLVGSESTSPNIRRGDRRLFISPESIDRERHRRERRKQEIARNYASRLQASRRWCQLQKARRLEKSGETAEAARIRELVRLGHL